MGLAIAKPCISQSFTKSPLCFIFSELFAYKLSKHHAITSLCINTKLCNNLLNNWTIIPLSLGNN